MINICILLLSLSLLNDNVEGVHDVVPKPPHNNKENNLFLVDPGELSKPNQMAEQITEQDLADMLSGSGELPPMLLDMANGSITETDVIMGSIHSLVSTISLLLNVIVIVFLCCPSVTSTKFFRSSQAFVILHVCLSSLLLVATMMTSASYRLSTNWYFGRFCCKVNNWLKAFGIISQAYFCTLLLVEYYLQLRHSSFIRRTIEKNRTRAKLLVVFVGWMIAFVLSYPFWVRTTYYTNTSNDLTTCSIDTFDHDDLDEQDYATYMRNGQLVYNLTIDSIATYDDESDLYVDYDYDNQPYECHMEETSVSFRFWFGSLVVFGYFIPLVVIAVIAAVLKCRSRRTNTATTAATAGSKTEVVQSKCFVYLLILVFVACWLPLSVFKAGKVFHGLPLYRDQCLLVRDIGSIMGYFSCLALPAATMLYMVLVQRRHGNNPAAMSTSSLEEEKKQQLDNDDDEEAALCDVITNRCDDDSAKKEGGDWRH